MMAAFMVALGSASAANASIYYLQNVTFDDGTSATGSFSTNVYGYPAGHDVNTSDGTLTGYHYTNNINVSYNPGDSTIVLNRLAYVGFLSLSVGVPIDSITDATPAALLPSSFECSSNNCGNGTTRNIVSGFLTTVAPAAPEAASWAMMIIGVGGVGGALRSRRRATAPVSAALPA